MTAVQRGVPGHAVGANAHRFHVHSTSFAETGTAFDREYGRTSRDLQQRCDIGLSGYGMHRDLNALQQTTGRLFDPPHCTSRRAELLPRLDSSGNVPASNRPTVICCRCGGPE